ncbi:MAG: hypothetical protein Q7U60_01810 [Candidatus Methanoperedens sp.]|nr:hypothetical protein [Candidatus Methanoperedens sp.]
MSGNIKQTRESKENSPRVHTEMEIKGSNPKLSGDFGEKSGVSSEYGYYYQKLIAAYYLIVQEAREIEYEADGEDVTIINEAPNRDSIEYIQVKYMEAGSFSFTKFTTDVFPQFWDAFIKALEKDSSKAIYCSLVSNVAWGKDLKLFMDRCFKLQKSGLSLHDFDRSLTILRRYPSMKSGRNPEDFRRFIWGLNTITSFSPDYVRDKILKYISECGISEPHSKLALIINHISEVGQGRITRRQIEDLIHSNLTLAKSRLDKPIYSSAQISNILEGLNKANSNYGTRKKIPDTEDIIRSMTSPIEKASMVFINSLEEKGKTSDIRGECIEACDIIKSDAQKAKEHAIAIADLKCKLWMHQIKYTQRIKSMQTTYINFGEDK